MQDQPESQAIEQAELIDGLLQPAAYPHPVTRVRHIETHISHVLLTGRYAYKIKKPVSLGFLDFSTLERRRYFCEEELRLNRRMSPDLYLAVVPITGSPHDPRVEGDGAAIEYAVRMREFAQEAVFESLLGSQALTPMMIDGLALAVARFHAEATRAAIDSDHGTAAEVANTIRQNADQLSRVLDDAADREALTGLREWLDTTLRAHSTEFEDRKRRGAVRELHGDLHLGNIAWIDDAPRLFDCIEFDPALRWLDVIDEVAFCMMDLDARGAPGLAWRFLDGYLSASGDYAGLALLRCYRVHRALVRAKVARLRAQAAPERARNSVAVLRARAYLDAARRAQAAGDPVLLVMHGLSGSGKSALAQALLEVMPAVRVRADVERQRLHRPEAGVAGSTDPGTGAYTQAMTRSTYAALLDAIERALDSGYSAIADGTCLRRWQRALLADAARTRGLRYWIVDCHAPLAHLRDRIENRRRHGRDPSEATQAVLDWQIAGAEPLDASERERLIAIDTHALPMAAAVARVQAHLRAPEHGVRPS